MRLEKKPKISVIIPIYNCECFLADCVHSVLSQTFKNLEIVMIDDGSTDSSSTICDLFAKRYENIQVVHQANTGVCAARNKGISIAKGDYLIFLDADDTMFDPDLVSALYSKHHDKTMVAGGIIQINEDGIANGISNVMPDKNIEVSSFIKELFYERKYGYLGYVTAKLFDKSIIENYNLSFDEGLYYNEDRLFILQYVRHCEEVQFVTNCSHYRQREGSAMDALKRDYKSNMLTELIAFEKMKGILKELDGELFQYVSLLTFERSLFLLHKIPKDCSSDIQFTRNCMRTNARICICNKNIPIVRRIKIIIHSLLEV